MIGYLIKFRGILFFPVSLLLSIFGSISSISSLVQGNFINGSSDGLVK